MPDTAAVGTLLHGISIRGRARRTERDRSSVSSLERTQTTEMSTAEPEQAGQYASHQFQTYISDVSFQAPSLCSHPQIFLPIFLRGALATSAALAGRTLRPTRACACASMGVCETRLASRHRYHPTRKVFNSCRSAKGATRRDTLHSDQAPTRCRVSSGTMDTRRHQRPSSLTRWHLCPRPKRLPARRRRSGRRGAVPGHRPVRGARLGDEAPRRREARMAFLCGLLSLLGPGLQVGSVGATAAGCWPRQLAVLTANLGRLDAQG